MKHITKVRELYEETIHWISKSEDSWKNFLSCMGRLYQLDFLNTCMVYAQRPDASVLAGYDAWHEMDLPVARGSKGIAVFPSKIFGEGVTHVYDIQDVKGQGIRPWNWQVNGTNRRLLARELFPEIYEQEKKFKNSLDAFTRTNVWLMIEEEDEILKSLQKLAVLTGEGQEVKENQITEFLVNSVCYAVESRCGIRDDTLDFSFICGFSENEEILYRTGRLVSHLSGRIVLQIARTMKNIDLERRQYYGRNRRNPVQGNEWRTDTSFRGRDERGEDAGVPEPLRQDRSTGNEENGPGPIRNDAPVREIDGETYENPDRSGGIPRETGRKSSEDLDQRGQDRPLQHVGNDQSSDTGGYGSTETGYGGDHSPQDRIKQKKTEEDTEKGTASAVPFPSGEIEPVQPENWQKEKILLEMTEREIPYKIYEFYRNNPEETDREAYLYEVYGDVKREAHTKDGILTAESCPSGFYILWSKETSMKEAFWYWDEVSFEIGKRIERGTYLPLLSVSEQALENGEDIEETLQPENTQEVFEEKKPFPLEEIGIAFYKQNIQADILKKMLCLVYTTNQLPEEKNHFLKMLLLREVPEGQPYYLVRTEHGNYELCIQESGIRITLPESQDFLQELSWDQFGGLTAHLAEDDQIAYTEDAETLEQQENMYRLLPWFPALWEEKNLVQTDSREEAGDYYYPEGWLQFTGGDKSRYQKNIRSIRILKILEQEERNATKEEQEILAGYVGWGGLPNAFNSKRPEWKKEYQELKELLTAEEYAQARASVNSSFYTPPEVVRGVYKALEQFGFQKGKILEPAMGIGNFFHGLPESMRKSQLYGVEIDSISGRIAQKLHPSANIQIKGFEKTEFEDNSFDVVVGNVPFGDFRLYDPRYKKMKLKVHDYFIRKSMDLLRPGGILAVVTSKGTLDKNDSTVRKNLAEQADLLGAVRLPADSFGKSANTAVTSDLLFFQKKAEPLMGEPIWTYTGLTEDMVPVNEYYLEHPEMMLGKMVWFEQFFGKDSKYTALVNNAEDFDLEKGILDAVGELPQNCYEESIAEKKEEAQDVLAASPKIPNYTFTVIQDEVYYREGESLYRSQAKESVKRRMPNTTSNEVSYRYGFNGTCCTMATGCTTGIDSIGFAYDQIRCGELDVMICGAAEAPITPITIAAFEAIGTLSTNNNPPEKASRPFDDTRNGFVLAEAAGILVLEELGHALNRGAHIYGEIGGYGSVNNAMHMTGLKPDGEDLSRAIKIAIEEANITPFEIDYINAHGSGTKQNDINETGAYKKVFGELAYKIPMSSTKSMTGHPLGAASAVEAIVCCLALENNFMPPTINYNKKDALCDLDYIPNCGREKNLNVVLTNASGFGGLHAAMILKKYID